MWGEKDDLKDRSAVYFFFLPIFLSSSLSSFHLFFLPLVFPFFLSKTCFLSLSELSSASGPSWGSRTSSRSRTRTASSAFLASSHLKRQQIKTWRKLYLHSAVCRLCVPERWRHGDRVRFSPRMGRNIWASSEKYDGGLIALHTRGVLDLLVGSVTSKLGIFLGWFSDYPVGG